MFLVKVFSLLFLLCFGSAAYSHTEGVKRREDQKVVNRIFFAYGKCIGVVYNAETKELVDFGVCWKNEEEDHEVGDGEAKGISARSEGSKICFQTTGKYLTFPSVLVEFRPVDGVMKEVKQDKMRLLFVKRPVKKCY